MPPTRVNPHGALAADAVLSLLLRFCPSPQFPRKSPKGTAINPRQYLDSREKGGKPPDDKVDLENHQVGYSVADSGRDCRSGCVPFGLPDPP